MKTAFQHFSTCFQDWDAEKFNWAEGSGDLARYCSEYFNVWWDPDKFNFRLNLWDLLHGSKEINTWWDSNKFNKYADDGCIKYLEELRKKEG